MTPTILDELAVAFAATGDAEPVQRDSCRPHGIVRPVCVPVTDRQAAARAWLPAPCPDRTVWA